MGASWCRPAARADSPCRPGQRAACAAGRRLTAGVISPDRGRCAHAGWAGRLQSGERAAGRPEPGRGRESAGVGGGWLGSVLQHGNACRGTHAGRPKRSGARGSGLRHVAGDVRRVRSVAGAGGFGGSGREHALARTGPWIGRIAPAPDGSGVLFSVVPSNLLLAEAFHARGDAFTLEACAPPALFWLARGSSAAVLLSYSGQPTFAPVTVDAEAG